MVVAAIIVTYYPDPGRLKQVADAALGQAEFIFIIDNTPGPNRNDHYTLSSDRIFFYACNENIGIAAAQNIGIRRAEQCLADYILFLDQDSLPDKYMVSTLVNTWESLESKGYKLAAVGPSVKNSKDKRIYKASIDIGKEIDKYTREVGQLISSGSLIKTPVFREVGLFEEGLFIDDVDFEWCWRAARKRYHCFRVGGTFISHQFGQGERLFLGIRVPVPAPGRCYYLYRNYLRLLRRSYVPLYWKASYLFKLSVRMIYYIVFIKPQKEYARNIRKGIADGLRR